jgi:hypothetical protein
MVKVFRKKCKSGIKINLSAHLCGKWVRDIVYYGIIPHELLSSGIFKRVQLNIHNIKSADINFIVGLKKLINDYGLEVILPWNGIHTELIDMAKNNDIKISALYDISGGHGIQISKFIYPIDKVMFGYAGGIGVDNIVQILDSLKQLLPVNYKTWIDMETKTRSENNFFDLYLVKEILKLCSIYGIVLNDKKI